MAGLDLRCSPLLPLGTLVMAWVIGCQGDLNQDQTGAQNSPKNTGGAVSTSTPATEEGGSGSTNESANGGAAEDSGGSPGSDQGGTSSNSSSRATGGRRDSSQGGSTARNSVNGGSGGSGGKSSSSTRTWPSFGGRAQGGSVSNPTTSGTTPGGATSGGTTSVSTLSNAAAQEYVDAHNKIRAAVTAPANYSGTWVPLPNVTWSDEVAASAQKWADHLRDELNCGLQHEGSGTGLGENLAAGTGLTPTKAVEMWASEKSVFTYTKPFSYTAAAGHYTQLVWRTSVEIGCASATCNRSVVISCRYKPPGNMIGGQIF